MIQRYFNITDIPYLNENKDRIVETVNYDLRSYMNSMPDTEKLKYHKLLTTDFIKMFYIPVKYTFGVEGLPARNINELFNFSVDSVEQNQDNGRGLRAKEIEQAVDMKYYPYYERDYFSKTLQLLISHIHSSWVIFYKKGAIVHPHSHDNTTILTHVLLEDIPNGEFVIDVEGEKKIIKNKGDYFIFCGGNTHSAAFSGQRAKFVTFSIELKNINKKE